MNNTLVQFTKDRPYLRTVFIFLASLLLAGCAAESGALDLTYGRLAHESPAHFKVCHGYGCFYETDTYFSDAQWNTITAIFDPPASTPETERHQIAAAIAKMEDLVGEAVGTQTDEGGAAFIMTNSGQMDCIDETINTSRYLKFFESDNLLRWHTVGKPTRRGYFIDGAWPHNSAVIKDKATNARYVVDSWFFPNGDKPVIIPVETWLAGWRPQE